MKVQIECPFCGEKYEVDDEQAKAQRMECGKCGMKFSPSGVNLPKFTFDAKKMDSKFEHAITAVVVIKYIGFASLLTSILAVIGAVNGDGKFAEMAVILIASGIAAVIPTMIIETILEALRHTCESEACTREYQMKMLDLAINNKR